MSEPKLKPCPFCGGEAETRVTTARQYTEFKVYCPKCHIDKHWVVDCDGTFEDAETAMHRAAEDWNKRADK